MMDTLKIVGISAVVSVLVIAAASMTGLVGGDSQTGLGGPFRLQNSSIQANTNGRDNDHFLGGTTDSNLFYVDAGNDRVGVSTSTPLDLFHVENGSGTTTQILSSGGGTNKGGAIIVEDNDGAGCTEIETLNGSVVGINVTCPSGI